MPYAAESYAEVLRWLENTEIEYVPNGKRAGTKSYDRYERYSKAKTVVDALEFGSLPLDLVHDFQAQLLRRVGGPVRETPLNLMEIEDTTTLTKTDIILAKWGYLVSRKEARKPGEGPSPAKDAAAGEEGKVRPAMKEEMRKQKEVWRKARLSARFGVKVQDFSTRTGWAESPNMVAQRSRANVESGKILEDAAKEGRGVTDEEVLRVLRLWAVRRNADRVCVMPEGTKWVHSEVVGLLRCGGGRLLATLHTREYPNVIRLFVQWMRDNRPEGYDIDFPFTSMVINAAYAANKHRDHHNLGAQVVKAFGAFTGGRLRYWPDDNKTNSAEVLRDKDAILLDNRATGALIDGNRCHAVEPYEGEERFSLVFFTTQDCWKASEEVREKLAKVNIRIPSQKEMDYASHRLPTAKGYNLPQSAKPKLFDASSADAKLNKIPLGSVGLLVRMLAKQRALGPRLSEPANPATGAKTPETTSGGGMLKRMLARRASKEASSAQASAGEAAGDPVARPRKKQRRANSTAPPTEANPKQPQVVATEPSTAAPGVSVGAEPTTCLTQPAAKQDRGFDAHARDRAACSRFSELVTVLGVPQELPGVTAESLAEYLADLLHASVDPEPLLRDVLDALDPPEPIPLGVVAGAVEEAFRPHVMEGLNDEALASAALVGRCAKTLPDGTPPLLLTEVVEAVATCRAAVRRGDRTLNAQEHLVKVVLASRAEGQETMFLVRLLQGRLGLPRATLHAAVAHVMAQTRRVQQQRIT